MEIGWEGRQREESQMTTRLLALVMGWVGCVICQDGKTRRWAGFQDGGGGGEELTSLIYFQSQSHQLISLCQPHSPHCVTYHHNPHPHPTLPQVCLTFSELPQQQEE